MIYRKFVSHYSKTSILKVIYCHPSSQLSKSTSLTFCERSHSCERYPNIGHLQEDLLDKSHLLSITRYVLISLVQSQSLEV